MVDNDNKLIFLGTGTSAGIPIIACDCEACVSCDPHDRRYRSSVLVRIDGKNILIDATPELRLQCLDNNVRELDACLITHCHADHVVGMDDLRRFNQTQKKLLDVYVADKHIDSLRKMFGYAEVQRDDFRRSDWPQLKFREFAAGMDAFEIGGIKVDSFYQKHGSSYSVGYRMGNFAYCSDLSVMDDEQIKALQGLEVLVLGALRHREHSAHLSFDQAGQLAKKIGAKRTYFIHMSHDVVHERDCKTLGDSVMLAYDGLEVYF